jgi:hypothetical protein
MRYVERIRNICGSRRKRMLKREESNEPLEGDVETVESHKSRDQKLAKNKKDEVCTQR